MFDGQSTVSHDAGTFVKKRKHRRRRTSLRLPRLHSSLHRISPERDLRHEAADKGMRGVLIGSLGIAAWVILLVVLYLYTKVTGDPAPVIPK